MIKRFLRRLIPKRSHSTFDFVQKALGVTPRNQVFYAPIESNNSSSSSDFQRLEFLGDAVLGAVVSSYLFQLYPEKNEGALTEMKAKIVNRNQLNKIAINLGLNSLYHPNQKNLGKDFYGNLLEALIGAIFLDHGYRVTQAVIEKKILSTEFVQSLDHTILSFKNYWMEWGQKKKVKVEFLTEQEHGSENFFRCQLTIGTELKAIGRASSKKKAEEIAAKRAFFQKEKLI